MKVLVVAGEASGDKRVSSVIREIRKDNQGKSIEFFGLAGDLSRQEGVELLEHISATAVMGLTEVLGSIPFMLKLMKRIVKEAIERRAEAAILVDYPDFNLRLAKKLKQHDIKVLYYISPQLWAWRRGRIETIRKYVDKMLVIFPFEKEFYDRQGVDVEFVGHPVVDEIKTPAEETACRKEGLVGILPGSRNHEIKYILPLFLDVVKRLDHEFGDKIAFKILVAGTVNSSEISRMCAERKLEKRILFERSGDIGSMKDCSCAMVASGTATLEMGMMGIPMLVAYRVSHVSSVLFKVIARYSGFVAMVNLIHGREIAREFILDDARVDRIYDEMKRLIGDDTYREEMRAELNKTRLLLGEGNSSLRAAREILNAIG